MAGTEDLEFVSTVQDLRAEYETKRQSTNLYFVEGRAILDVVIEIAKYGDKDVDVYLYWFEQGSDIIFIRLSDIPGTLSGDVLRLYCNLPPHTGHLEIHGNRFRPLHDAPPVPQASTADDEDVSDELARLPIVLIDPASTFAKKPKYRSEIVNLLKVQGSEHIITLLGRTEDGLLVFPKHAKVYSMFAEATSIKQYKTWILQLLLGLKDLHQAGIIHRDLRLNNLLADGDCLLVCDLESRRGNRTAPEISRHDTLDAGWSEQSDIWDIGQCIKCMIYANDPINNAVEWPVPPPFAAIVEACQRRNPEDRASLDQLLDMVRSI